MGEHSLSDTALLAAFTYGRRVYTEQV